MTYITILVYRIIHVSLTLCVYLKGFEVMMACTVASSMVCSSDSMNTLSIGVIAWKAVLVVRSRAPGGSRSSEQ